MPIPSPHPFCRRPLHFLWAALFLAVAALAGCANNPYPPGESTGRVRYVAWAEDLKTLDPTISYDVSGATIIDNIYECYFRYHHLRQRPYVLELGLGAAEPTRATVTVTANDPDTGKPVTKQVEEWTFRIRPGLRFQDDPCFPGGKGREVTAADFVYAWRRMADPSLDCPVLSFVQDKVWGLDALVKHNEERAKAKQPADYKYPVPGLVLDAADPYTFRIRLVQPYPQLRYLMAMHFTTPMAHEAIAKYGPDFARHPVGCGTFVMTEYKPKQRVTLTKNPNRPQENYPTDGDPGDREAGLLRDAGKPLPLLDKIVFVWTKEGVTSWNLFQQGYLDSVGVSQNNFNQVLQGPGRLTPEMEKRGIRLLKQDVPNIWYFAFNLNDPVWGGMSERAKKLRHAVSLSIDRQQFIDVQLQGLGRPADGAIPPGIFGYEAGYRGPYSRTDVEQAKRLLAEAGYPGGIDAKTGQRLKLTIDVAEGGAAERQASLLLKQWVEASGIAADIQAWQGVAWQKRVREGKTQFFRYSWYADYPDAENFFQLFYSKNIGGVNYAGYKEPEFDRMFEQMSGMSDGPERMAVMRRMRDKLAEDAPWIFFYHGQGMTISYPWVRNGKPHGMAYDTLRYEAVDGDGRAAFQRERNRPNPLPLVAVAGLVVAAALPAAATMKARQNRSVRRRRQDAEDAAS
jgi:ABC-type transport system substrate-binding protein